MVATLIIDNDRLTGEYPMFDLRSLDEAGAVLCGPLFLEVGELLVLRLDAPAGNVQLEARVHSVAPHEECMTVHFLETHPKLNGLL
jgi:hypothetical protein